MSKAQTILDRKGTKVTTIERKATVLDAAVAMNRDRIGALVVIDGDHVVGIFTERDILDRVVAAGKVPGETNVSEVMTSPMACCRRETPLNECKSVMSAKRIRHLPVLEGNRLYGLISTGDILANEVAEQQTTIEYLHEYLYGRA